MARPFCFFFPVGKKTVFREGRDFQPWVGNQILAGYVEKSGATTTWDAPSMNLAIGGEAKPAHNRFQQKNPCPTPWKFNSSQLEKWWERKTFAFPIGMVHFQGRAVKLPGGGVQSDFFQGKKINQPSGSQRDFRKTRRVSPWNLLMN